MNTNSSPSYKQVAMNFNRGVWSAKDAAQIPPNAIASGVNIQITDQWGPSKCLGRQKYNTTETGSSTAVKGAISYIAENGQEFIIKACNNKLYWSNGNGAFTAVKYNTEAVDVTIDTANHYFSFLLFVSNAGVKYIYVTSDVYPIATNANGTANKKCTKSTGLRLYISGSNTIVANNIWYDTAGGAGGADDVQIGDVSGSSVSFPKSAKYSCKVLNRMLYANYSGATNGYICSEAAGGLSDLLMFTNSSTSSNTGGGNYPEDYTACIAVDTRVFIFSRHSILVVNTVPGPLTSWRESFVPTVLGNIGLQVALHSDGWVYYISEQGLARTNGAIAERVDYEVEDNIKNLSQLVNSLQSISISTTASFNNGTPSNGDNLLSTAGNTLQQRPQASKADWEAGTLTNVSTTEVVNSVVLARAQTAIYNGGFDSDLSGWTNTTGAWTWNNTNNQSNPGHAQALNLYTDKPLLGTYIVLSTRTGVLSKTIANADWTQYTFTEAQILAAGITLPQTLTIAFYGSNGAGEQSPLTQNVFWTGGDFSVYAKQGFRDSNHYDIYIDTVVCTNSNYYTQYSGTVITQAFDFGVTPTTLGNLTAQVNIPTNNQILGFFVKTSADNITYSAETYIGEATYGTTNFTGSLSGATPARYLKVRVLVNGYPIFGATTSPKLTSIVIGGQWISQTQDLTATPGAWGLFSANDTNLGKTLTYEMDTSTNGSSWDGFVAITSGAIPTHTLRRYVRFRATFSTDDYTMLPYLNGITLNYYSGSAVKSLPAVFSFKDKIYAAFTENGQTTNNIAWVGETKLVADIQYAQSLLTGIPYPQWTKRDFVASNFFFTYANNLMSCNSTNGFIDYEETGTTNRGSAFTSYFTTGALNIDDVSILLRYLYVHYRANSPFSLQYRTRLGQDDWGAWSTAITVPSASNQSRSNKLVPVGIVKADYIQFKVSTSATDIGWAVDQIFPNVATYARGR